MRTRNQITKLLTWAKQRRHPFNVEDYHKYSGNPRTRIIALVYYLVRNEELIRVRKRNRTTTAQYKLTQLGKEHSGIRVNLNPKHSNNYNEYPSPRISN